MICVKRDAHGGRRWRPLRAGQQVERPEYIISLKIRQGNIFAVNLTVDLQLARRTLHGGIQR